jgi:hypothetical protein
MSKYKFTGTVDDIYACDFYDDHLDHLEEPIQIEPQNKTWDAIRTTLNPNIAVAISSDNTIKVYRFKGKPEHHQFLCNVRHPEPYIQDLIDLNIAEKEK